MGDVEQPGERDRLRDPAMTLMPNVRERPTHELKVEEETFFVTQTVAFFLFLSSHTLRPVTMKESQVILCLSTRHFC